METAAIIRYVRRLAAARGEVLLYPLQLEEHTVMCRDELRAQLIQSLYRSWMREAQERR